MSPKFSAQLYLLIIICLLCAFSTQAQTATHKTPFDFDGDNKTDFTVYRPSNSAWYIFQSQTQTSRSEVFGVSTDRIVPGDYDGDGKDDLAVFRPTDMTWYIQQSRDGFRYQQWGLAGDLPFAGDYDGDGRTDLVVIRTGPDNLLTWHILRSQLGYIAYNFGEVGDIPVRGDFDGDNKTEVALWRPSNGGWQYIRSTNNQLVIQYWGTGSLGDMVGAGDYDGDGKTDLAVWRSMTGVWYVLQSSNGATVSYQFGGSAYGDVPVPGDYDGDGKYDYAVWRVPTGVWHVQRSQLGYLALQWGSTAQGDKLAPHAFMPTGTVVGTVKSDADAPVAGALVEVTEQGNLKGVTTTASTGYFFLPGVRTGQYEIKVSYKSASASADCSTDAYQDARLTGIGLLAGGTTNVNVTLARQKICLEDNFDAAGLGSLWQKGLIGQSNINDANVNIVNQRLEVDVPASSGQPEKFNGIRTVSSSYNLRDAYVAARVIKVPIESNQPNNQSEARLEVGLSSTQLLRITVGDRLVLWKKIGLVNTELRNIAFNRVTKGYIRIRFKHEPLANDPDRGQLFLETSQSGTDGSWVSESSAGVVFNDFDLSAVRASLSGGSWGQLTGASKAILDDFKFGKYNALVAKAGEDQTLAHNNSGPSLQGSYQCDGCTNISNLTYKWTLASKPVGAPDPIINAPTSASTGLSSINFPGSYNFQFTVRATYTFNGQSYTSASTDTVRLYIAEEPVARISAPASIMEDEPIVFDGNLSSSAYEYEWDFGDGRKAELARSTHMYMSPRAYTVSLTVKTELCNGLTTAQCIQLGGAHTVTKNITVTALPAATTTVTLPPCDANAGQNLRNAISAASGRTDIILRAGCDYSTLNLPYKSGNDYIVLKSNSSLPPKGTRISEANIANMPTISTFSADPAMNTSAGAHHYRFVGILFRRSGYYGEVGTLVEISDPETGISPIENQPHHFVFDRCIFSNVELGGGNPTTNVRMRRGIAINSGTTSIINSYFKEIKSGQTDAHAIGCWAGVGPHAIFNNYLEGAGQGILYGGSYMNIPYASPSDITVRGNYFFKPLRWNLPREEPGIKVKNIFELKHARNVIVEGNVMENSFARGQAGEAFMLTTGDDSESNPWTTIQNVQITNNKVDYVGRAVNVAGIDHNPATSTIPASRFNISNNLWTRVGDVPVHDPDPPAEPAPTPTPGSTDGRFMMIRDMPEHFRVVHNTVFHTGSVLYGNASPHLTNDSGFRFDNNILKHNINGFDGDESAPSHGFDFLNTYAPGWRMRRNLMFFPPAKDNNRIYYPNDSLNMNQYVLDTNGYPLFNSQFVNPAQGNYRLTTSSLGYGGATDGSNVGCNIDQLDAAIAGAQAGNWAIP